MKNNVDPGIIMKLSTYLFLFTLIFISSCDDAKVAQTNKAIPQAAEFKPVEDTYTQKLHGQLIYIPIYSSIYNQDQENLLHMTAVLSIRNISPTSEIIIRRIEYFDTNGKLLKKYIEKPFSLGKMSTKDFVIAQHDLQGGTGANFLVEWDAQQKVALPLIEAVMFASFGTKGFSFSSRGKEVESH